MKNHPQRALRVASSSDSKTGKSYEPYLSDRAVSPQANSSSEVADALAGDGIHIAALWKSRRDRRQAIQVSLRSYEGHPYVDARVYATNPFGRMVPTTKGITVGVAKLPQFAKAIGDALRMAHKLGLTAVSS